MKAQIEGIGLDVAVRFCPICDGYEAIDRRIGVLGTKAEAGPKALFLRTYSGQVMLFETDKSGAADIGDALTQAGIQRVGRPVRVERLDDGVRVTVAGGNRFDLDVLYPALGCQVRSELAAALDADRTEIGIGDIVFISSRLPLVTRRSPQPPSTIALAEIRGSDLKNGDSRQAAQAHGSGAGAARISGIVDGRCKNGRQGPQNETHVRSAVLGDLGAHGRLPCASAAVRNR